MSGGDIGDIGTSVAGSKNAVENNSLSVDNARKDLKSITEDLKQKVRDTGGENQVTAYINGAVIIASELGDAGLATVDTAFDVLALITTCALGDSYCSQAKADYAKINGTIAANVDALFISGKAWTEIGKMLDKANNGDQVAQENTIALMASILSPSKLVSGKIVNGVTKVEELITNTNKINKVENVIADASTVNKIENSTNPGTRPPDKQSEIDVGANLGAEYKAQVSYKDGVEVPYGTKGSVRPDWCNGTTCSIEVKNYNIETNTNNLINNVSQQALDRQIHLPQGMQQQIVIDVRGQNLTPALIDKIRQGVAQKSNGIIKPEQIKFMTE